MEAVAQGRVWTGNQARQRGLVDAIGGCPAPWPLPRSAPASPLIRRYWQQHALLTCP